MRAHRLCDFDYELPPELIAQTPAPARTASRLLHVAGERREDRRFTDLPALLRAGDLVVFNDTRVVKARLRAVKPTGGTVELLLERIVGTHEGVFQLRASHPPKRGGEVILEGGVRALVRERDGRFVHLVVETHESLADHLDRHGAVPLPPYIARRPEPQDELRYQTVYARHRGAVAAPTAGLHFDAPLIARLEDAGIAIAYLTLHVGAGTFSPVSGEDLAHHRMHREWYRIPAATAAAVAAARARGGRVVAVGTTSLRALESAADARGDVAAREAETALFVTPGYRFRVVDRLLTNFHLPRSTLLMLVCAFGGFERIRAAYAHAIAARYRFYSYGDAMLVERDPAAGIES
jgi:S-adenosylmethionine:tRNA ribosyltransferase-isomerase